MRKGGRKGERKGGRKGGRERGRERGRKQEDLLTTNVSKDFIIDRSKVRSTDGARVNSSRVGGQT